MHSAGSAHDTRTREHKNEASPNAIAELLPELRIMLRATDRAPTTIDLYLRVLRALEAYRALVGLTATRTSALWLGVCGP